MKNILKKSLQIPAMIAACILTIVSCDDWTESESLDIQTPLTDAGIYNDYLETLRVYKTGPHKTVFVTFENSDTYPNGQAQNLTVLPDSVDFISLVNADNLHHAIVQEMDEVRKKGTRVIYNIDFQTFENEWDKLLTEDLKGELTEEDALVYFTDRTKQMLALCDKFGYDGLTFTYNGRPLVSLPVADVPAYSARQKSFLEPIADWKKEHTGKVISFIGNPQYLVKENREVLSACDYIIVDTNNAKSSGDLTRNVLYAVGVDGVPSDRIIVSCQTTDPDDKKGKYGYFSEIDEEGNPLRSVYGCALWCIKNSQYFTRAGVLISHAERDYFNPSLIYKNIREAIGIMNPSPKN